MNKNIGTIGWHDLTVNNIDEVKTFYEQVVGWQSSPIDMGEYNDYAMTPNESKEPSAGLCHAKGPNANLPPQWLMYIYVADIDASILAVHDNGGKVLTDVKSSGGTSKYVIIEDPAGAVCALYQE